MPPCVIFEDEHLLVVDKPAGLNTHAPGPFAGEGIYEWLRHREPRHAGLAIIHRLDKETSGVMVFANSPAANRSLTEQFAQHTVRKQYRLLTDRPVKAEKFTVVSALVRAGEKYLSRPLHAGAARAETRFRVVGSERGRALLEAEPVTGRTHQIRAHAAFSGFPILGDTLYGGTPAARVCLHSAGLNFKHPVTGAQLDFESPADFDADSATALREKLINPRETDAFRLVHGAADGRPGWYVEKLGQYLLSQSVEPLDGARMEELRRLMEFHGVRGAYHKILTRQTRQRSVPQSSPRHVLGEPAPSCFSVRENGRQFELSFAEGYSTGLFLDQRENRRRLLVNHVAAGFPLFPGGADRAEVLNVFAYTCGFSVCAVQAGARATSVDLSKKYLAWGRRNFELNGLDPASHGFIFGDALEWLRRLAKKGRAFDLVVLDPPTFSQSKERGAFRAEKDYGSLVRAALPLVKSGGVLFASANAARLEPETFLADVTGAVESARRKILSRHYVPQPPDFPIHRGEPAHLKTVWLRIS